MDISQLLKDLTLEEKCSLLVGKDAWRTKNINRLDIPSIFMADGPHGLRKVIDNSSVHETTAIAVCYPSLVTLASSFDPKLSELMGNSIAKEFKANGVNLILGPGINIKRHPYCGRNFEYFSEDPHVTIKMAEGFIKGAKKEDIGVCLKHYALNSQEDYRMTSNSIADARAKYEIYYKSFQELVKLEPEMVMCSYNKVDAAYASENFNHLQNVLRDEFGFNGIIVSDWAAVNDRTKALIASLDLEMPGVVYSIHKLIDDVNNGNLDIKYIDNSVKRILELVDKFKDQEIKITDLDKLHENARKIAENSFVLLKNEDELLPLNTHERILLVGDMAKKVRYQGGGSSHINTYKVNSIYNALSDYDNVYYSQGYDSDTEEIDNQLIDELKNLAPNYDKVVVVCGLTDIFESEGYDRQHLDIPKNQEFVINQLSKLNEHLILLLQIGSPIRMPYYHNVKSILNCYLGGEAIGKAVENVIFGKVNPSGRLAETFPKKHNDVSSDPYFNTGNNNVFYQESIYVGYRYYQSISNDVLFPFGHGLSYSHFDYGNMMLSRKELKDKKTHITVSVDVTNLSERDGQEVVLLFFETKNPKTPRPKRELIGFNKVMIKANETKTVVFKVYTESLKYYNPAIPSFVTDNGIYNLQICKNARDILIERPIIVDLNDKYTSSIWNELDSYKPIKGLTFNTSEFEKLINQEVKDQQIEHLRPFTINNNIEDIGNTFYGKIIYNQMKKKALNDFEDQDEQFKRMMMASLKTMPIRAIAQLSQGELGMNTTIGLIHLVNHRYLKAFKHLVRKD